MPHKFRGKERYNPNVGTELHIKKLSPGSEEGEGYEVSVYQDGEFKENVREHSKKNVSKLIKEYKEYYNTDRAFLNEMKLFITYKIRESSMDIDKCLNEKLAHAEKLLNRLFDPSLPIIKQAVAPQMQEAVTTEEIITEAKDTVNKFLNDNKSLIGEHGKAINGEAKSKLYNSFMKWVSEFGKAIDAEIATGANIDKQAIISALSSEFGFYEFLQDGDSKAPAQPQPQTETQQPKAASSLSGVSVTLSEGEPIDITSEDAIDNLVDLMNGISNATPAQIDCADKISDNICVDPLSLGTDQIISLKNAFYRFITDAKYSGTLEPALESWVLANDIGYKTTEQIYAMIKMDVEGTTSAKIAHSTMLRMALGMVISSNGINWDICIKQNDYELMTAVFVQALLICLKDDATQIAGTQDINERYQELFERFVQLAQATLNIPGDVYAQDIGQPYKSVAYSIDHAKQIIQDNSQAYLQYVFDGSTTDDELLAVSNSVPATQQAV